MHHVRQIIKLRNRKNIASCYKRNYLRRIETYYLKNCVQMKAVTKQFGQIGNSEYPKHEWNLEFFRKWLCFLHAMAGTFILNLLYRYQSSKYLLLCHEIFDPLHMHIWYLFMVIYRPFKVAQLYQQALFSNPNFHMKFRRIGFNSCCSIKKVVKFLKCRIVEDSRC